MTIKRILAVSWTLAILVLHAIPRKQFLQMPGQSLTLKEGPDKIAHVGLFAIFIVLWGLAVPKRPWLLLVAGIVYGIVLELMQTYFIAGRSGSVADLVADSIGLVVGLGALAIAAKTLLAVRPTPESPKN